MHFYKGNFHKGYLLGDFHEEIFLGLAGFIAGSGWWVMSGSGKVPKYVRKENYQGGREARGPGKPQSWTSGHDTPGCKIANLTILQNVFFSGKI